MVLTINIGNTNLTLGGYEPENGRLRQKFCGQIHTNPLATAEEYAIRIKNLLTLYDCAPEQIDGAILGSVAPMLTSRVQTALNLLTPIRVLTVGPGLKSGLKLRLDNPAQLGAELLCGVVAALDEAGSGPVVVIHADTAITMMAANRSGELVGGAILPGPQLALRSLVQNTAQLPQVDLEHRSPKSVLGTNTAACLENGMVLGTASMLDGMAERFRAELGEDTRFFVAGSLPQSVLNACVTPMLCRKSLVSDGLARIWEKNRK